MSQSSEPDARSDLESALTQIAGVADVLMELGVKDEVSAYLGGQLEQHYRAALDAFSRIYGLGKYKSEAQP
jgi:hypothetical protein